MLALLAVLAAVSSALRCYALRCAALRCCALRCAALFCARPVDVISAKALRLTRLCLPTRCSAQMAVPQLRPPAAWRTFNTELAGKEFDLAAWRASSPRARTCDFSLLDRQGGAGEPEQQRACVRACVVCVCVCVRGGR